MGGGALGREDQVLAKGREMEQKVCALLRGVNSLTDFAVSGAFSLGGSHLSLAEEMQNP